MKKSTVRVYDTISKEYVDIEVSEEVYTYYNSAFVNKKLSHLANKKVSQL